MYQRKKSFQVEVPKKFSLNITSMADMFTILLVFLLQSYTVAAFKVEPQQDLALPTSMSPSTPTEMAQIIISKTALKLENQEIGTLNDLSKLTLALKQLKQEKSDTDWVKNGEILLQVDRDHEYSLIKKVMQTARDSGFAKIKLATLSGE